MPPALDRLLASPSALRLLRSLVSDPELPAARATASTCCHLGASRRNYSNHRNPPPKQKWRRWKEAREETAGRDTTDMPGAEPATLDKLKISLGRGKDNDTSWAATLAHRERLQKSQGVKSTWEECRRRGYRLPTNETPDAEFLWATFIKHPQLVERVIDHAAELLKETGKTYPRFYELVMSSWLPLAPKQALEYHHQILVKLNLRKLPLRDLASIGCSAFRPLAYEALMDIYRTSNERDLYDVVVPSLIDKGNITMARRWHMLCTFRNDVPSEIVARHPVVRIFIAEASTIPNTEVRSVSKNTSKKPRQQASRYNEDLMRRLLGRDTAPVRFEDSFCARMFATRSFSPESVIQGLAVVGVNEIGPQAVLAMASRTQPVEDLPRLFEQLEAAGIALQGSVFSLALEKFAKEQKWQLVRSMLDSDQHPDVFGDAEVQRKLLQYYLDQEDFVQTQRTLAILTLFHDDPNAESWNMILQAYIKRSGPQHVLEVLQDMRNWDVMLSLESIIAIKSLLRPRQPGHKPGLSTRGRFDDLRFVTRVFMTILESGIGAISPSAWREIICRFGMLGRFRELRRLLLWLLCWYAPRSKAQFVDLPNPPFLELATKKLRASCAERNHYFQFPAMVTQRESPLHPIRLLFKPSLQQALIIWGFRAGLLPNAHFEQSMLGPTLEKKHYRRRLLQNQTLSRVDWSIGLRTVVQLRDLGVHVHRHTVLKALQMQFVVLFGHGKSSKKENRIMEEVNSIPYATYVQEVNRIWGSPLLMEPQSVGKDALHDQLWHPRLRRNTNRGTSISLNDVLGKNWQTSSSNKEREPRNGKKANVNLDAIALDNLQAHFAAQTRGAEPGIDFLGPENADVLNWKSSNPAGVARD